MNLDTVEQRVLANVAAAQAALTILVIDCAGCWLAQVELEPGAEGRALIRDVATPLPGRAAARPGAGRNAG